MTAIHHVNPWKFARVQLARLASFSAMGTTASLRLRFARLFDRSIIGLGSACLVVAAAAVPLSGCSSDAPFPAVHDMPAARAETLLTPDEIKQSTDDLLSDRDRLAAMSLGMQR
jgi:hypothetical protein